MQARLAAAEFSADAGGGVVSATVNGKMQLVGLKIAKEVLADGDAAMLEDLIRAAVSAAQAKAAAATAEAMKDLTGGISIPGLDGMM